MASTAFLQFSRLFDVPPRIFIIGVQCQGPLEVRECVLDVPFARERVSEVVVRLHVVGISGASPSERSKNSIA